MAGGFDLFPGGGPVSISIGPANLGSVSVDIVPDAVGRKLGSATFPWDAHLRVVVIENQGAGADITIQANDATGELSIAGNVLVQGNLRASELRGTSLNIDGTTVFEQDRDFAVHLVPNAHNTLNIGSGTRAIANTYVRNLVIDNAGAGADITLFASDATGELTISGNVLVQGNFRASEVRGTSFNLNGETFLSALGVLTIFNQGAGADITLQANDGTGELTIAGNVLVQGNLRASELRGTSLNIDGTTVFEQDRDFAVSLVPNADNTLTAGTAARRLASVNGVSFLAYAAASAANPTYKASASGGFEAGPGGASAVDIYLRRTAGGAWSMNSELQNAGDIYARQGGAGQLGIGNMGPGGEAGIQFAGDDRFYRASSGVLQTASKLLVGGELELDGALNHDGASVGFYGTAPIAQGAAVADAAGGATIDTEARTAVNALLARIRALGLIAT